MYWDFEIMPIIAPTKKQLPTSKSDFVNRNPP